MSALKLVQVHYSALLPSVSSLFTSSVLHNRDRLASLRALPCLCHLCKDGLPGWRRKGSPNSVLLAICGSSVIGCWFLVKYSAALVMYCWVSSGSSSMFSPRAIHSSAVWACVVGNQLLQRRGEIVGVACSRSHTGRRVPGFRSGSRRQHRDVAWHPVAKCRARNARDKLVLARLRQTCGCWALRA